MNIYVGNLPYSMTDDDLKKTFEDYGQVSSANIIRDQFSDRSKGFGFVEMPDQTEARAAIGALNGKEFNGRPLTVNEARPRAEGGRGGFDKKRGGGGGGRNRW